MRQSKGIFSLKWVLLPVMVAAIGMISSADGFASSMLYKNYIVRYDRGWDILCEPYVVKKNDWILKIFRQKGEIAHEDFRDFTAIFKRLNPHIKNIDLIRPGQGIDIPLRKLEQGALPGQTTGIVTIPFVTLREVTEVIKEHSQLYTVRKGDMVSRLISRKYGRYGSKPYREGIKLFKAANPQVTSLELIYVGQKLHLPDPSIKDKSWYDAMYDDQGNLRKTVDQSKSTPSETPPSKPQPKVVAATAPPEPEAPEPTPHLGNLAVAAKFVGGKLRSKGTYYLPRQGGDLELDLSEHPMLEMDKGPKMIFTPNDKIMNMDKGAFQAQWPETKPVSVDPSATTEQYVSAIFGALGEDQNQTDELTMEKQGVHIAVRAKWIRAESDGRQLCITPIAAADEQTPEAIKRFLEQNGIVIKEILPGGSTIGLSQGGKQRHIIKNILAITPSGQKDFVQILAKTLTFSYIPNTKITFPYAGIQVEAYTNLLSTNTGQDAVVDFGDLYGDAVAAIGKTGLNVVQIIPEDSYNAIAEKLLNALSIHFERGPTLLAAQRSAEYNTAITIYGLLFENGDNRRTLLTSATLHSAVTDMLSDRGIDVVVW